MIEPFPLARSDESPERRASPQSKKRTRALRVVIPMSKQVPLTEYSPWRHQAMYRLTWSFRSQPVQAMLSARASAMLVSSVHSPGAKPWGPPLR